MSVRAATSLASRPTGGGDSFRQPIIAQPCREATISLFRRESTLSKTPIQVNMEAAVPRVMHVREPTLAIRSQELMEGEKKRQTVTPGCGRSGKEEVGTCGGRMMGALLPATRRCSLCAVLQGTVHAQVVQRMSGVVRVSAQVICTSSRSASTD